MRVVSSLLILSLLTSAFAAITVRHAKHGDHKHEKYDYKKYNTREYTEADKKCAGAPGYPYVHYAPCPKGYECKEKDSYDDGDWGLYCVKSKGDADKCYKDGARCMGAKNKPYVPYYPCCSSSSVCMEDEKLGWGSFCVDIGYKYESPKKEVKVVKKVKEVKKVKKDYGYGKCHSTGKRCLGAKGYPYVEYGDGCCDEKEKCVVSKKYGDWGGFCVKVDDYDDDDDKKVYIYKKPEEVVEKKKVYYEEYGYPIEKEEKDDDGHIFWGKKTKWEPTCINTSYYGCKVEAENEFYYRQAVVRMSDDYKPCCKDSDICYRGYCKPKTIIPHGKTGGKPTGGDKIKIPKDLFPKFSPWF